MEPGLYEKDFYDWAMKNAELIRQGKLSEVDLENVAEELESMGRSEKRELIDRLAVLIMHLLKWQYQAQLQSNSWIGTILEQRRKLLLLLEDSPSLKHGVEKNMERAYDLAQLKFQKETGINRKTLPESCPYTCEQVMDDDFLPE